MSNILTIVFLFFLVLGALCQVQQYRQLDVIDDFDTNFALVTDEVGVTVSNSSRDPKVLGGERDVSITVTNSTTGANAIINAAGGDLYFSTGFGVFATVVLQYDGFDSSPALNAGDNANNLNDKDLTLGGKADSVLLSFSSDHEFEAVVSFYSSGGRVSSARNIVPPNPGFEEVLVPFYQFRGDADPKAIVAFELRVVSTEDATDTIIGAMKLVTTSTRIELIAPFSGPCLLPSSSSSSSSSSLSLDSSAPSNDTSSSTTTRSSSLSSRHNIAIIASLSRFLATQTSHDACCNKDVSTLDQNQFLSNNIIIAAPQSSSSSLRPLSLLLLAILTFFSLSFSSVL